MISAQNIASSSSVGVIHRHRFAVLGENSICHLSRFHLYYRTISVSLSNACMDHDQMCSFKEASYFSITEHMNAARWTRQEILSLPNIRQLHRMHPAMEHINRDACSKRHSLQVVELSQQTRTAVQIVSNPPAPSNGGPIYRFLGMPAMRTRWMAGAAAHKSG